MTPAERLAAKKPRHRAPRNKVVRRLTWVCELRAKREELRLTLRDVADALKMSPACLHQIEHGGDPMLTTARKLAAFFGTTTDELWPKARK